MEHPRRAVNHTLEGGACQRPAGVEYHGESVCEEHARRFEFGIGEDGTHWEGVVFHLESWAKNAYGSGDWETLGELEGLRAKAALELYLSRLASEAKRLVSVADGSSVNNPMHALELIPVTSRVKIDP